MRGPRAGTTVPFDFSELFEFKDSFVMKYPKSREYLAYFYLVGDT